MPLPRMETAQLSLVRQPFDHPDFLFELKQDGFRALAYIACINDGHCELISRRRKAYKSFGELRGHLSRRAQSKKCRNRRRTGVLGRGGVQHLQRITFP
jgi:ATP-dependent DNA ligase